MRWKAVDETYNLPHASRDRNVQNFADDFLENFRQNNFEEFVRN